MSLITPLPQATLSNHPQPVLTIQPLLKDHSPPVLQAPAPIVLQPTLQVPPAPPPYTAAASAAPVSLAQPTSQQLLPPKTANWTPGYTPPGTPPSFSYYDSTPRVRTCHFQILEQCQNKQREIDSCVPSSDNTGSSEKYKIDIAEIYSQCDWSYKNWLLTIAPQHVFECVKGCACFHLVCFYMLLLPACVFHHHWYANRSADSLSPPTIVGHRRWSFTTGVDGATLPQGSNRPKHSPPNATIHTPSAFAGFDAG
jgi:hypothetical protein